MEEKGASKSILNIRNLVILTVFGLMIWFVIVVRGIIGVFLFSMVLSFLLYPLVEFFCKRRIPRSLSILIVFIILICAISLVLLLIVPPMIFQAQTLLDRLIGTEGTESLADKFTASLTHFEDSINNRFGTSIQIKSIYDANKEHVNKFITNMFSSVGGVVGSVASFITLLVSIPVICFYLLMDWPKIKISLMRFLPPYMTDSTTSLMNRLTFTLNSYLRGQIKLSAIMFIITSSSLLFLNMLGSTFPHFGFHIGPYLILGMLAGITEVIPIVGPLIAFTPALILGFLDSTGTGVTVILLYGLIQWIEGNILVPRIMGTKLDVHPLTVMFALLCGGLLGGIGGMLLALPAAATLKVLFDQYYPEFIKNVENLIMEKRKESDSQAPAS
jgi:predicted PurR-regulated permease PerM